MTLRENAAGFSTEMLPPAYFLSLSIENFRCFGPKQTLDLTDGNGHPAQWTILLGENGVGKTTLLQGVMISRPTMTKPSRYDTAEYVCAGEPSGFELRPRQSEPASYTITCEFAIGSLVSDAIRKPYRLEYCGYSPTEATGYPLWAPPMDVFICGYSSNRKAAKKPRFRASSRDYTSMLFDDDVDLPNAEDWLLKTNYASVVGATTQMEKAKSRLKSIVELLTKVLPDVQQIHFTTSNDNSMDPQVELKTPYGIVRLADLSMGYKSALTWMVDFARHLSEHYPDSPNPLAEPAICLVDEIDLHLHPRWQRELVQKLTETFPNTQFIVTAHSPLIVQAAPNANLALLRREGDHIVIDNDVDEIRNWRVDQILTSDLFGLETARPPQLAPALEERRRILSQPDLSDDDRKRLAELDAEINAQTSVGKNPLEMRALDALRRAAALLE